VDLRVLAREVGAMDAWEEIVPENQDRATAKGVTASKTPMDHAETVAQRLVESILRGSRMEYREDQSRSIHDFDLHHADGRISAVEVTASVDRVKQQANAAILDRRKGGPVIKAHLSKKDWYITPDARAEIANIRKKADRCLAVIESAGVEKFFGPTDWDIPGVERIYRELGVWSGSVLSLGRPGYISIGPPGGGGAVGAVLATNAVLKEAVKNDNRKKLGAAKTEERHLMVYIDLGNYLAWCALVDFEPKPEVPKLPPEITHVWAFSETRKPGEFVVWRAGATLPWWSHRFALPGKGD
jgi:hypothetical protein